MQGADLVVSRKRSARLVSLMRLGEFQCKWPDRQDARVIGGYLFCGRPTQGKSCYCAMHQFRSHYGKFVRTETS
ncbi:MAG: GcrA family cell cycle regulator [Mesorhizobium sp.]